MTNQRVENFVSASEACNGFINDAPKLEQCMMGYNLYIVPHFCETQYAGNNDAIGVCRVGYTAQH